MFLIKENPVSSFTISAKARHEEKDTSIHSVCIRNALFIALPLNKIYSII